MRIVYFGTGDFAVPALEVAVPHVVLTVSQPGRPSGRGLKVRPSPVETRARELGLDVATPEKARDPEFIARVRDLAPDLLLVASYGQILRPALLEAARVAPINLHGSLLPRWRGAAPIQRAIEAGDGETGVTLMRMDAGMDTGDSIASAPTPIGPNETAGELSVRLARIAADLVAAWIPRLATGDFTATRQPETGVTLAPKIARDDARLDPRGDAKTQYDRFRAFTPAPGAWLATDAGPLKIHAARLRLGPVVGTGAAPGSMSLEEDAPALNLIGGSLALLTVQPAGKPRMSGRDWANGARLQTGQTLP